MLYPLSYERAFAQCTERSGVAAEWRPRSLQATGYETPIGALVSTTSGWVCFTCMYEVFGVLLELIRGGVRAVSRR